MLKIKSLILALIVVLVTTFSFQGILVSAKTTSKNGKQSIKKTAVKKTSNKQVSKKAAVKKKTASKKHLVRVKKSKVVASKTKRRGYSRGSGSTLGYGSAMNIISYAKKFLGVTYDFGSSSSRAFDCSGFTMYVFRAAGIELPHSAAGQANLGIAIGNKGDLEPGDLVFFETYKPGISHVGMYIGNDHFIHASSGKGEVTISKLSDAYYSKRYRGGTRLIND